MDKSGIRDDKNCGNFLSIIELLSKYDPLLEDLHRKPAGCVRYLHHRNQEEIIQLLSNEVVTNIVKAITSFVFFKIITDNSRQFEGDQLTQAIRYVAIDRNDLNVPVKIIIMKVS